MPKLILLVMVLAVGSCKSGSLRSGGVGGHGGNTGSVGGGGGSGSTGGASGTGGLTGSGGTVSTGGVPSSPDAELDGRLDGVLDVRSPDIDAPAADLAGDKADASDETPIASGCDATAATTAMSALGIVTVGNPQMISATLPAALATEANWGLKATVCQQAGYDITALAGKTVCLLEQDMAQTCQGIPATAWVVMSNGAVACVYKTVRQGLGTAPGIYAANDANCTPPAIAPGATVSCEGRSCTNATGPCCPATQTMNRVGMCWSGCSVAVTCDGPEDCSNGAVCCSLEAASGLEGTSCVSPAQCTAPSRVICRQQSDCLASQTCGTPDPKPAFISTYPYAESTSWRVSYQVCAP